ncbi:MAG: VCBS domain-containing protein, partial [Desulfovibrio sp.]|nr:VCBS domain-containing protein [Desulfovibrio sp.]
MSAPHILYMPPAGHETILKGLSHQSRIELNFSMHALFVGVKGNDLVFFRNDGARLVLEGYLAPLDSSAIETGAPGAGPDVTALLRAGPPAIIIDGKEMSPAFFFSSLGEEGMPEADTPAAREATYEEHRHSELQDGINALGGRLYDGTLAGNGKAKTDADANGNANGLVSGMGTLDGGTGTDPGNPGGGTGTDPGNPGGGTGTDPGNPGGGNAAPSTAPAYASMTEDDLGVNGQIPAPHDASTGQHLSFVPQSDIAGLYGSFSVDASGAYSYQLNNLLPNVQGLAAGQALTETFTYTVADGQGGTIANTVTITINGLNDAPTVASTATALAEDQDNTSGTLPTPQDPDTSDSPQYLVQTDTPGLYGSLSLNADGSFTYTLNNNLPVVQELGRADFLTETFNYSVDDGHGGTASGNLVVTIYGTNDVPAVMAATAMVDEDGPVLMGQLPTPQDVDASDTPQFIPQAGSVGAYGVLAVDALGNYSYVLDNTRPEIQALSQGDTLTDQFVFTVTDGQSQVSKTLTVTINGTNDTPTVAASSASLTEHGGLVGGTLPNPQDVDANDSLNFVEQHGTPGLYGSLSVDAAGNYIYIPSYAVPDLQNLAEGQQLTDIFTYTVDDGHGGTATNTLTITINGTNDAPQVRAAVASITEDQASISGKLPTPTDTDAGDTVNFLPQTNAPGLYGSFTLQTNGTYTYSLNNALPIVQQLGVGAQLTEILTYTVTDQHGATATNTLTVTISGTNDAPQVSAATAAINEDQASVSGSLPIPDDIDA